MNWITIVWPMIAAASLTLAGVHGLVWVRNRQARAHLAFSVLAACIAWIAALELSLGHAPTPAESGMLLKWIQVPVFLAIAALVAFVQLYLQTGRQWLAHAVWGSRLLVLVINFFVSPNLIYQEITGLRPVEIWGAPVQVAQGIASHWQWLDRINILLLLAFVADASVTLWRRGDRLSRRQAVTVGWGLFFFILMAGAPVMLMHAQVIAWPYMVSPPFLIMIVAMGYELSQDVLRSAELAAELRETDERMKLAADAAKLGLWVWDIPSDEIWGTDYGRELFGFSQTERLSFARFEAALHPQDRDRVRLTIQQALDGDGEYDTEFRLLLADGQVRWIAARGRVEFGAKRKPQRMRGTVMDITWHKQAENEAKLSRDALAHATRVSTMGELSASLAHELNQPLSAILSNAQAAQRFLALGVPDLAEVRAALQDIAEDGNRAGEVIRRLRAMVQRTTVELLPVELEQVTRDVVELLHSDAVLRGVTIVLDLVPGLPAVRGDHVQLQQVLLNLLLNAFDAVGGVPPIDREVTIRIAQIEGRAVRVSVHDRGIGLSDELRARLFEPFHTTKPHGLGMGLTISRSIVEAHGGRLWGENNPDRGATFHFELPLHQP